MKASIVIPLYGKWALTERCLESLEAALGPRLGTEIEVVVVDNASPDDSAERLDAWRDRVEVILLEQNRNFGGGNNVGARAATGEVVIFLNNDTVVGPGTLEALAETAAAADVGAAGLRMLYPDGTIQHGGFAWLRDGERVVTAHLFHHDRGDTPAANAVFDLRAVTGACLATRRDLFLELGGFDEQFVNGWEDVDYCLRAGARGLRVVYRGDLSIVHDEGQTTGRDYRGDENEQRFLARHGAHVDDGELLERTFGGMAHSLQRGGGAVHGQGAPLLLAGPLLGLCGTAVELRTLLALTEAMALGVAARALDNGRPSPLVTEAEAECVVQAQSRPVAPFGLEVLVHGRGPLPPGRGSGIVRLASTDGVELDRVETAWTASSRLADELRACGVDAHVLLPAIGEYAPGAGGGGVLAVLPAHDLELGRRIAAELGDVTFLPTVASPLLAELSGRRPLLAPCAAEVTFAELAGRFDVVVALDPADPFQRRALVAAVAGATPVFAAGGAAEEVLGASHAVEGGIADAVARALASGRDLEARARVLAACGGHASADRLAELVTRAYLRRATSRRIAA